MRIVLSFNCLLLFYAFSSSAQQQDSVNFANQFAKFQEAVLNRDTVVLSSLYTSDPTNLLQTSPILNGRSDIIARWKRSFQIPFQLKLEPLKFNFYPAGLVYCYGTFSAVDPAGKVMATGKWLHVWKKENGVWRLALEMDNFNPLGK